MAEVPQSKEGRRVTVHVPMAFTKRGGRKLVLAPDGGSTASTRARVDNAMIKALARAFRWRRLLEAGASATVAEMAAAEKINASYVSRVLRLTLLAPEIVEVVLDGRQPATMTLKALTQPFPFCWEQQLRIFGLYLSAPTLRSAFE